MKITNIEVTLVDKMGTDLTVCNAARVSFAKETDWQFSDCGKVLKEGDRKLIKYLAEHNHWSPFAHAFVQFRVKAPIFVARQLAKHQSGLVWNEVSRRYVSTEPEFYLPKTWRKAAENVKQGSSDEAVDLDIFRYEYQFEEGDLFYPEDIVAFSNHCYKYLMKAGVCAEQARMVLPQNTMTEWIWSGSLYAFARVCNLRLESHTQLETREVAQQISDYMIELFPESWNVLVK